MSKVGLVFLVVTQILVVQAIALAQESEAPLPLMELKAKREVQLNDENGFKAEAAESPNIRRLGKHLHHSTNKSVAGGGVIIGGLVTATFAVVYCYIRVTRKKDSGDVNGGGH